MFVTKYLCLSQTVCVCQSQSVSVTDHMCLSQTVFLVTESLHPSQKVYVCHRQLLSVAENICLSEKICLSQTLSVCHRQSVFVTVPLYLSHIVFVCHKKFFVSQSVSLSNTLLDHSWHGPYFLIRDFHHVLSVRFYFVRN